MTYQVPDYSVLYKGMTNREIEIESGKETCCHDHPRIECPSSMCHVWTVEELNADRDPEDQIDPEAIPFP